MGVRIDTSAVDALAFRRVTRDEGPGLFRRGRGELAPAGRTPESQQREQPPRAGFGEGTVSLPGAALRTVKRNLYEARRVVPSVEEMRREAAARIRQEQARLEAESRIGGREARAPEPHRAVDPEAEAAERRAEEVAAPDPQRLRPKAAPQSRVFEEQQEAIPRVRGQRATPAPAPRPAPERQPPGTPVRLDILI